MTPAPGDLVVLNTDTVAWAEVEEGVYKIPDPWHDNSDSLKVQVLRGEHGLVRKVLGLVVLVFWSHSGRSGVVFPEHLTVVASPMPSADLTRALKAKTV